MLNTDMCLAIDIDPASNGRLVSITPILTPIRQEILVVAIASKYLSTV